MSSQTERHRRPETVPLQPRDGQEDSAHQNLLGVVWRRRWTVLAVTAASLLAAVVYLAQAEPIYQSSARVYIEQTGPRILSDSPWDRTSFNYLNTQAELMRSTPILAGALELAAQKLPSLADLNNGVAYLKSALQVEVGKNDDLVTVSLESPDPRQAAVLVNSVVESYVEYQSRQQRWTAAELLKILNREKDRRDAELAEKLRAMLEFKQANGALSFESDRGNIITQKLARLSEALTTAQLQTVEAQAAYDAAQAIKDPTQLRQLVQMQQSRQTGVGPERGGGALAVELGRLELQLDLAREKLGPEHPEVRMKELAVQALRQRLAEQDQLTAAASSERDGEFAEAYRAAVLHALQTARARQQQIQQAFEQQQKEAMELNSKAAVFATLEAEVRRIEKLCDILDTRIKELNLTGNTGALNISILETAQVPDRPVKPHKSRVAGMALVLGLMLGIAAALAVEWTDQRLRTPEDVRSVLDLRVVGSVPRMSAKLAFSQRGRQVHLDPMSQVAEAYRTVRTAVLFGLPAGAARKMLVTSPTPGDGKTVCVSNLAIAMAQAGQRVLLLDADFRRPSQQRVFGLDQRMGLSRVLLENVPLDKAIAPTGIENLDVLPCGPPPANPSELINSQAFGAMLQTLAGKYDHVVIDSPPVVPVTDARILGALCDVTLLVIRSEKSSRRLARHALESLTSVGAKVLGVILNDVTRSGEPYGYAYAYGYAPLKRTAPGNGNGRASHTASHA